MEKVGLVRCTALQCRLEATLSLVFTCVIVRHLHLATVTRAPSWGTTIVL